ncbi:MAG TPA: hypothetical protein VJ974_01410 [Geopsychrobacteraceae bacterium]|nr:hypothetical protein [Geopsychrobacteraceae bacterium]
MTKMAVRIGMTASFLFLILTGAANAGSQPAIGTEAGDWEIKFDSPETKADLAAQNYEYNEESFAVMGTEAGNWEFRVNAPKTKADLAAQNYKYDKESFAAMGTEAGNWNSNFNSSDTKTDRVVAKEGDNTKTDCKC